MRYSTYLGGEGFEDVFDMTADRFGNAYLPGVTEAATFPVTRKAFQGSLLGVSDGYVTKLNRRGTGLEYSTYIGGSQDDVAGGVRVDSHGDAHIPGITGSPDFPVTNDAFQPTYGGGDSDAYLLTIPGFTNSDDFPVTPGAYQTTHRGGDDVFLVKIAAGPSPCRSSASRSSPPSRRRRPGGSSRAPRRCRSLALRPREWACVSIEPVGIAMSEAEARTRREDRPGVGLLRRVIASADGGWKE